MEKQDVSVQVAEDLGIDKESYDKIVESLGRNPNLLELQIYSVMWSENLSYKSSVSWISSLPNKGEYIISGARDSNAGVVDLGNGEYCVFKMGTHNHPSGIDPYQGAATCVGDVCRDIVSLGAKPQIILNSLRFGDSTLDRTKWLMDEIIKGINDYANVLYIEDIGSEIFYNSSYDTNPIVNIMVAGLVSKDKLLFNRTLEAGQKLFIVGNPTGSEGVFGQNESFTIPKGNPDLGNSLTEAILKLNEQDALVRVENMDMAGIINSCSVVSAHAKTGIDLDLNKIPLSHNGINVEEVLLSRTQERFMLVADKKNTDLIKKTFEEHKLICEEVGVLTNNKTIRFFESSKIVAEVIAKDLVMGFGAPQTDRKFHDLVQVDAIDYLETIPEPDNYWKVINKMVNNPNLVIKEHLQRNIEDRDNSPSDAQITFLGEDKKAVCFTVSGNSVYSFNNAYIGAQINIARAARRIVCSGGKPLAINDCLNFGSPLEENIYSQFVATIKGIAKASSFFETPVAGGNVSFYNESSVLGKRKAINPTPVIAMMGALPNKENHMSYIFRNKGEMIFLIGKSRNDISGSEYLCSYHQKCQVGIPHFNIEDEKAINNTVAKLIQAKLICSAHSVERGGLFFNLIESSMPLGLGFDITSPAEVRMDAFLFGEAQGRVVVSVSMENENEFVDMMMESGLPFSTLGHITKGELRIDDISYGYIDEYKKIYMKNNIIG
ncbi:phosphoribosylformylglycinamidine synthase subunit PurL [Marinifilum sp. D714]|uniref:phosphoribosylformylglycinamidine synthase subunit PurL n=1 Tax=Marinifilum sp. D714 TaxID=2937523 RepID=UPI0027C30E12|nr:phosphoribosylformylglycinamidine synthase subunit PurL [Marinifilum sp. D714]MDQ2178217.1 phosphoribosylformylglycinamidine synthase subunit PurL [Marinifilum sp. D714]